MGDPVVGLALVDIAQPCFLVMNFASALDVSDCTAITSFHTSDGTPSAPGALLFGVSASAPVISDHSMVLSHSW
ncbi:hypothetical protein AYI70_g10754 [Smittium culicis]|uniref:Uncharacterized protein n=1 Tax=Smittium culicis TaxID=133412 RepID=A0A1R1X541_9FUNG|nr:hypothetical protein AYI70_g10754 [Smittium culicis]